MICMGQFTVPIESGNTVTFMHLMLKVAKFESQMMKDISHYMFICFLTSGRLKINSKTMFFGQCNVPIESGNSDLS